MDPRLRLQAELKDNASPGIRKIGKELRDVKKNQGMEQAQKWFEGFNKEAMAFTKSRIDITGTMGALGLGGLTAAGSLAGLTLQFKALADHTYKMQQLGAATGMTINQINQWEKTAGRFHVPTDVFEGVLEGWSEQMRLFVQKRNELFGKLNSVDAGEANKLVGLAKDPSAQFMEVFRWMSTLKTTAEQNYWAKEFFGVETMQQLISKGFPALQEKFEKVKATTKEITQEQLDQADKFNTALSDFNGALGNFETQVAPKFLGALTTILDKLTPFFNPDHVAIAKAQHDGGAADEAKRAGPQATPEQLRKWFSDKPIPPELMPTEPKSTDGNALHRFPTTDGPAPGAKPRGMFDWLWHRTAFVSGMSGGGSEGESALSDGVKAGVLAAFREWKQETEEAQGGKGDGSGGGFSNASLETWDSPGGGAGGGGPLSLSGGDATGEHANYIRQLAKRFGIDPRVAVAVAKSEGLDNPIGDHGTSFGDFQLHYGGGLGDIFTKQTGLDARDPKNWRAADEWALKYASKKGWGDWHGARRIGVTGMFGISGGGSAGSGDAVGIAEGLLGANSSRAQNALRSRMTPGEWCADFVNGVIKGAGGKGVNSSMAAAFSTWGHAVGLNDVKRGDVILERHGNRIGHVGLATGRTNANGDIEMISGNYGGAVRRNWEHRGQIGGLRRGLPDLVDEAAKAAADRTAAQNGSIEAHIHLHEGKPRGVSAKSTGVVAPPKVHLRRGPTMTQPDYQA